MLVFGLILILVGAVTGSIFVVLFGLFILIPGLVTSRGKTVPAGRPPPPPPARHAPAKVEPQVPAKVSLPPVPEDRRASSPYAPIFPAPFLPTLNNPSTVIPSAPQVSAQLSAQAQEKDEILEMLALLGLLKLLSRR